MRPRRSLRHTAVALAAAVCAVTAGAALVMPSTAVARGGPTRAVPQARFDLPYSGFAAASTVLHDSSPAGAGLDARPIDDALAQIAGWTEPIGATHPLYAGAVDRVLKHEVERTRMNDIVEEVG